MAIKLQNPIPGARLTDKFGNRGWVPGLGDLGFHNGQDFAAAAGTPIRAAHSGVVRSFWDTGGGGNSTIVDAGDYFTQYSHMQGPGIIPAGRYVTAGTIVGYVGSTGAATGPHLHFITFIYGVGVVDPLKYMNTGGGATPKPKPKPQPKDELMKLIDCIDKKNYGGNGHIWALVGPGFFLTTMNKGLANEWARSYGNSRRVSGPVFRRWRTDVRRGFMG